MAPFRALFRIPAVSCIALLLLSQACAGSTLAALDDKDLSEVSAQQGITFDLEYRINTNADGSPVNTSECPNVGALTGGESCRMAYSLADSSGMWIVAKGYRGMIKLTNVRIDASTLAGDWTSRTSGSAAGTGGKALYMNPNLCIDPAGCFDANGKPVNDTSRYYNPVGKPTFQLTAGNWATALGTSNAATGNPDYFTYLNQPNYTDFTTSLYVDRLTAEFDSGCSTVNGNTSCTNRDGYLQNKVKGAPIALRMASGVGYVPDPANPPDVMLGPYGNEPAKVRLDGHLQIYGFGF